MIWNIFLNNNYQAYILFKYWEIFLEGSINIKPLVSFSLLAKAKKNPKKVQKRSKKKVLKKSKKKFKIRSKKKLKKKQKKNPK